MLFKGQEGAEEVDSIADTLDMNKATKACEILASRFMAVGTAAVMDPESSCFQKSYATPLGEARLEMIARARAEIERTVNPMLARCARCHVGEARVGPEFPFDRSDQLVDYLKKHPGFAKHVEDLITGADFPKMPPTRELSTDEKRDVLRYLKDLQSF